MSSLKLNCPSDHYQSIQLELLHLLKYCALNGTVFGERSCYGLTFRQPFNFIIEGMQHFAAENFYRSDDHIHITISFTHPFSFTTPVYRCLQKYKTIKWVLYFPRQNSSINLCKNYFFLSIP